jgi:hypothetical protein
LRGELYDDYTKQIEKRIKVESDMEFLKTYQKVSNNFKHSGLATKAGPPEKPNGINSIVPPPLPAGFGVEVPRDVPIKKKLNAENTDMSHITVPNAWKMDPRKAANLYVKKICRDYNSKYQPTAEELRLEEEKKVIIQALTARSKEKLKTTSSPDAQGTQNTRQSEQNIGLQEFRDEDDRELQDERVSPPNESRKDIRPQSATAPVARIVSGDKSRKPHSAMSKNQSAGSIRPVSAVSKRPTSAATTAMPRPDSATTDLPMANNSPKFKRIQSARRGIEPFEYEVPDENIVEVRCMLHPTIQRAWKAPTDTYRKQFHQLKNNNHHKFSLIKSFAQHLEFSKRETFGPQLPTFKLHNRENQPSSTISGSSEQEQWEITTPITPKNNSLRPKVLSTSIKPLI